jgi:hypothetical protein
MYVPVTVLLPERVSLIVLNQNYSEYLKKILCPDFYEPWIQKLPPGKAWKKTYQPEGQSLIRISFRTDEVLWGELSQLSHATGYSRCYLFSYLLDHYLRQSCTVVTNLRPEQERWIHCELKMKVEDRIMEKFLKTPTMERRKRLKTPRQGPSERPRRA